MSYVQHVGKTNYYVYILSSLNGVIYVGFTDCLVKRIKQHKNGLYKNAFTKKYNVHKLVYWEHYFLRQDALNREQQIKSYNRNKKINLIEKDNKHWNDLYPFIIELSKRRPIF
ncbi:GIY-YIG nuclease family protein [Candidatus Parcubacteria bacterium]|jgi:putative endonuclease|nr:GIY-YIG nuclease family protein [Candidatus Parcubacteria bacterium]MBT3948510.1 GIY-YIG nuclease family protein [Candidatus Parcubacteria bacterium]